MHDSKEYHFNTYSIACIYMVSSIILTAIRALSYPIFFSRARIVVVAVQSVSCV